MTTSRSHCARCGSALVLHATGRPKAYCSAACRVAASRARLAAPVQLDDQLPGQRALALDVFDGEALAHELLYAEASRNYWEPYSSGQLVAAGAWCTSVLRTETYWVRLATAIFVELSTRVL